MAQASRRIGRTTITMIGPPSSGKTHLIAALLMERPIEDMKLGPDAVSNPGILADEQKDDEEQAIVWTMLREHYERMITGRESDVEGTSKLRAYEFALTWGGGDGKPKGLFSRSESRSELPGRLDLRLVDGRGGDLASAEHIRKADDEEAFRRRDEYLKVVRESVGLIACLPLAGGGLSGAALGDLHGNIDAVFQEKAQSKGAAPLRHLALCLTKYEAMFADTGAEAFAEATDPETFRGIAKKSGYGDIIRAIAAHRSTVAVRVFPVSAYGFVLGKGAANYYPWSAAPGLLTRQVDETDYRDPRRPGLADHFPVPITLNRAKDLWVPFNLAPPVLFAATGKVTGPVSLGAHEVV